MRPSSRITTFDVSSAASRGSWVTCTTVLPAFVEEVRQECDELLLHRNVEIGEWLIEKHRDRIEHQGAGDCHPLLLTT